MDNKVDSFSGEVVSDWFGTFGIIVPCIMPIHFLWILVTSDSGL